MQLNWELNTEIISIIRFDRCPFLWESVPDDTVRTHIRINKYHTILTRHCFKSCRTSQSVILVAVNHFRTAVWHATDNLYTILSGFLTPQCPNTSNQSLSTEKPDLRLDLFTLNISLAHHLFIWEITNSLLQIWPLLKSFHLSLCWIKRLLFLTSL